MATPEMKVYAVWCECTTPQGDFRISRKGIYASVEDAQIGLKYSLKGGQYAEMIIEGKDITPEFKGTLKVCNNIKYYDAIDDDPSRLYIWTKDIKGNTERLSIGSHESRGYRLHTISSASAPPVKQVAEGCPSLLTSDKLSDTSDISACSDSGKSTPKTLDTPLTSPPSSPHAASNKFAPFGLDEECLSSRLFELAAKASVITAQSITGSVQQTSSISSEVSATSLSVSDTREQECDSRAHSHQEASKLSKAVETDYDAGSEDESDDDNHVETESDYDSLSIRGVKDGRFGSRIALKARDQTRRRFLTFLRRLCKVDE